MLMAEREQRVELWWMDYDKWWSLWVSLGGKRERLYVNFVCWRDA